MCITTMIAFEICNQFGVKNLAFAFFIGNHCNYIVSFDFIDFIFNILKYSIFYKWEWILPQKNGLILIKKIR
jgi:hypothetical protein